MTTLTQGPRAAEFILSEANGHRSRENGIMLSGEDLKAGTVLMFAGTKLVKYEVDTTGSSAIGVLLYDTDATDGDVACSYIARDAEVKRDYLIGPGDTDGDAEMEASLKLVGIIVR